MSYITKNILGHAYFSACMLFAAISSLFGFFGLWLLPDGSNLSYSSGIVTEIRETCYKEKYSCKLFFKLSSDENKTYIYEAFSKVPYGKLKQALNRPHQLTDVTLSYDAQNCLEDESRCWPLSVNVNGHSIVTLDDILKTERARSFLSLGFAFLSSLILFYNERIRRQRTQRRRQRRPSD